MREPLFIELDMKKNLFLKFTILSLFVSIFSFQVTFVFGYWLML